MASEGKGAVGAAGFGLLALVAGMGRFADDCGRVAARGASHAASGVDDMARLGRYGDEAAGLGAAGRYGDEAAGLGAASRYGDDLGAGPRSTALLDDVDPWRPLNPEGVTRGSARGATHGATLGAGQVDDALRLADGLEYSRWLEWGQDAVELGLQFMPEDDPLTNVFSGGVTAIAPSSLAEVRARVNESTDSIVVVTVEHEHVEGRAAVALAIADECRQAGRHCVVAVSSPGRFRNMADSAWAAASEGVDGLVRRLRDAAQLDGGTYLYRPAPDVEELRLIEFRPER